MYTVNKEFSVLLLFRWGFRGDEVPGIASQALLFLSEPPHIRGAPQHLHIGLKVTGGGAGPNKQFFGFTCKIAETQNMLLVRRRRMSVWKIF